jgi:microcystin-dependent protein
MEPYIGEIKIFAGTYAPVGWALCNGTLLPISENQPLFTLIGTTYGGDGVNTFAVPDLRGRAIVSQGRSLAGTTYVLGQMGGTESVTLLIPNMPSHQHTFSVSTQQGTTTAASNNFLASPVDPTPTNKTVLFYVPATAPGFASQPLLPGSLTPAGGTVPHENRQPFVSISYIIATVGIFPSFS